MQIRVHFPVTEEGCKMLQERVSELHAKYIVAYVQKLNCSGDEKARILEYIVSKASRNEKNITS